MDRFSLGLVFMAGDALGGVGVWFQRNPDAFLPERNPPKPAPLVITKELLVGRWCWRIGRDEPEQALAGRAGSPSPESGEASSRTSLNPVL